VATNRWAAIEYRDFYDFPRIFLVEDGARTLLFDCKFDQERDDYGEAYKVYLMPQLKEDEMAGSWQHLERKAKRFLGEISVSEVQFDPTRRRKVNLEILGKLG
jgi:hypothetical protein